jgi:hypothetical protein
MKRTFAAYVLLGLMGGCSYIRPDADYGNAPSALLPAQRPPAASPALWSQNGAASRPSLNALAQKGPTDPQPPLTITRPSPAAAPATMPTASLDGSTPISIPNATPPSVKTDTTNRVIPPKPAPEPTVIAVDSRTPKAATLPDKDPDVAPPDYVMPATSTSSKSEPKPDLRPQTKVEPKVLPVEGPSLEVSDARSDKPKELRPDRAEPGLNTLHSVAPEPPKTGPGPVVRLVNQKRITLNYQVREVGPSGVSGVELWYTRDGKTWRRDETGTETKPPYIIEVSEEGLYGFTLLAKNGIGLSNDPPKSGDAPQVWVEVDLTKPAVSMTEVRATVDGKGPALKIGWKASDKNMINQPITISYSEKENGPWQPIVSHLDNTGKFVWPLRSDLPGKIFVQVEARDLAGNLGSAKTTTAVQIDLTRPVVQITDVEPGKR